VSNRKTTLQLLAAVCKRPQWMPMAILLTSATMLYTSFAEEGGEDVERFAEQTTVQRAIREVLAAAAAKPSSPASVTRALLKLRAALQATYARDAASKVMVASVAWWACRT
jgi:hypothetical protein